MIAWLSFVFNLCKFLDLTVLIAFFSGTMYYKYCTNNGVSNRTNDAVEYGFTNKLHFYEQKKIG